MKEFPWRMRQGCISGLQKTGRSYLKQSEIFLNLGTFFNQEDLLIFIIMCSLPEEGSIVVVNIHSDCCDALALIAGANKPLHIPLPNFHIKM